MSDNYKWMEERQLQMEQMRKIGFKPYGYNYGTISFMAPERGSRSTHSIMTCTPVDVAIIVEKINELAGKEVL